jgi:hypothetical protein
MADHGHAPAKGGHGGGHGGGHSGGHSGPSPITLETGLGLFFGPPLALIVLAWLASSPNLLSLIICVILLTVCVLLPFWAFRICWTIPLKVKQDWGPASLPDWEWLKKLSRATVRFIFRLPATLLGCWICFYIWWQAFWTLWHGLYAYGGHWWVFALVSVGIAGAIFLMMNLYRTGLEWLVHKYTGIGWPEDHDHAHA